ncbi:uncharacterized protein FIESC28_08788 [Fusarium coffeatum]|uniref:Uncharacterized protein n=1 Tax=Fusarium coffeatum TaxID=231269 RepID=A0A366R657_9HYPO|nr:uncharacterized protein FIESC28_08788 [Fusarium coffeatum]RBR12018.1 hypothetical protein FIESC28_08788 [Fusarium coffeatum]
MRCYCATYKILLVTALVCLLTFGESKPASINRVASTSVSRCLKNAPRITEPPIPGPIELKKVKRQELGSDTYKPFTCAGSGLCTSLRRESIDYIGCCYGEGDCDIYTGCYDGEATMGTRTTGPHILSCLGTRPFCATLLWPQEPKTAYMCAEQPSTITVDRTADSPTPSSTNQDQSTAFEPTFGPGPPDITGAPPSPGGGPRPIAANQDLTKGQKIGIGAGCGAVGLLFAAALGYCCCCSKKRRQKNAPKNVSETRIVTASEVLETKPNVTESL